MAKNAVKPIARTSINTNTMTPGIFNVINVDGIEEACYMLRIVNDSQTNFDISFDGVTTHDTVFGGDSFNIPGQYNSQFAPVGLWPKGQKVYVRGAVSVGTVHLSGYYLTP